jgi:RIMS-binding protein 2
MVAKYDYDSRQLSPNGFKMGMGWGGGIKLAIVAVDAEQVELSFRQGDMIAVYGVVPGGGGRAVHPPPDQPMDEDGFFLGELNGIRGLVPSNFLQPVDALPTSRPKGVAFSSDLANHTSALPWPPNSTAVPRSVARRSAQQPEVAAAAKQQQQGPSAAARLTGATGMTSKAYKVSGIAPSAATKTLTKKSSDLSARALQQQSTSRKGSQAAGKGPPGAMKVVIVGGGGGGRD